MAVHKDQHKQFQERVVHIARVAKVVKGGRRFSFSALVCVGDHKSKVGFGLGKANEVPDAIRKAADVSNKNLIEVPVTDGTTIPFPVVGKSGSTRVLMYPAPPGKGIIAGSAARMIFDLCGIKDIVSKIHGSRNHHNVVRATFQGLAQLQSIEDYAALRGRLPDQVLQKTSTNRPAKTQPHTKNAAGPAVATPADAAATSPTHQTTTAEETPGAPQPRQAPSPAKSATSSSSADTAETKSETTPTSPDDKATTQEASKNSS